MPTLLTGGPESDADAAAPPPPERHRRRPAGWLRGGLAMLVLVGLVLAVAGRRTVAHQFELSFVRQPTPYTELFFAPPQPLPTGKAKTTTFRFSVHNREGRAITYEYVSTLQTAARTVPIGHGTIVLGSDQTGTRALTMPTPRGDRRFVVSVTLVGRPESVYFVGGATQ
jgi:hypothetical protein